MKITLMVASGVLAVAGCVVYYLTWDTEVPVQVVYKSYVGNNPVVVKSAELQPVTELESLIALPDTRVCPQQLLEYNGLLELPEDCPGGAVMVSFHKGRRIHNQGVELSTPHDKTHWAYSVRLNAPRDPGEYEVIVRWGDKHYVGKGRVIVENSIDPG